MCKAAAEVQHAQPTVSYCTALLLLVLTGWLCAGVCCILSPDCLIVAAGLQLIVTKVSLTELHCFLSRVKQEGQIIA